MTKSDEFPEECPAVQVPAEQDAAAQPAAGGEQSLPIGRQLETWGRFALVLGSAIFGLVLLLAALLVVDFARGVRVGLDALVGSAVSYVVLSLPPLGMMASGVWAVSRGRRHLNRVLPDLHSVPADERIVLFLRDFADDRGFARAAAFRPLRWIAWPPPVTSLELRTEEEQVARGVAPFGRMVALGRPSDRLPRSGAERSYASQGDWQRQVIAGLGRASLVLLTVGSGEGLQWEAEQVVCRDDPARLVLVLTRDRKHYADFREAMGDVFPKGLPDAPRRSASQARYVHAVIWFDPDWTPHVEPLTGRYPVFRSAARTERALPRALRPVYERARLREPVKGMTTRRRPRTVPASVALFVASLLSTPPGLVVVSVLQSRRPTAGSGLLPTSSIADSPLLLHGLVLVFAVPPLAVWMRRVLRGGPVAILMMQLCCLPLGALLLASPLALLGSPLPRLFPGTATMVLTALVGWNIAVLALPVSLLIFLFLFRREVREWVDSRT